MGLNVYASLYSRTRAVQHHTPLILYGRAQAASGMTARQTVPDAVGRLTEDTQFVGS